MVSHYDKTLGLMRESLQPYLDNFLTKCIYILVYSTDSDPESAEYGKICMHLVRKLSRYSNFTPSKTQTPENLMQEIKKCIDAIVDYDSFKLSKRTMIKVSFGPYLENFLTKWLGIW